MTPQFIAKKLSKTQASAVLALPQSGDFMLAPSRNFCTSLYCLKEKKIAPFVYANLVRMRHPTAMVNGHWPLPEGALTDLGIAVASYLRGQQND